MSLCQKNGCMKRVRYWQNYYFDYRDKDSTIDLGLCNQHYEYLLKNQHAFTEYSFYKWINHDDTKKTLLQRITMKLFNKVS